MQLLEYPTTNKAMVCTVLEWSVIKFVLLLEWNAAMVITSSFSTKSKPQKIHGWWAPAMIKNK